MSGGKIQGERPPQDNRTADEIIEQAKREMRSSFVTKPKGQNRIEDAPAAQNFSPPSAEHERPSTSSGERDIAGIAKGRI